jgi:hypothetical protein
MDLTLRLIVASVLFATALRSTAGTDQPVTARWNPRTTDWVRNPDPVVGDWGFDRPGYPLGLYVHGVTVKDGEPVGNPVIYDNEVYDDVFDDELAMVKAFSLGLLLDPNVYRHRAAPLRSAVQ